MLVCLVLEGANVGASDVRERDKNLHLVVVVVGFLGRGGHCAHDGSDNRLVDRRDLRPVVLRMLLLRLVMVWVGMALVRHHFRHRRGRAMVVWAVARSLERCLTDSGPGSGEDGESVGEQNVERDSPAVGRAAWNVVDEHADDENDLDADGGKERHRCRFDKEAQPSLDNGGRSLHLPPVMVGSVQEQTTTKGRSGKLHERVGEADGSGVPKNYLAFLVMTLCDRRHDVKVIQKKHHEGAEESAGEQGGDYTQDCQTL